MEKEFIPYEQALALKELGFNEICFGCYTENHELIIRIGNYRSFNNNESSNIIKNFNSYKNDTISVPIYQQAFKWFREIHYIHGFIVNSYIIDDNNYNCFINA